MLLKSSSLRNRDRRGSKLKSLQSNMFMVVLTYFLDFTFRIKEQTAFWWMIAFKRELLKLSQV